VVRTHDSFRPRRVPLLREMVALMKQRGKGPPQGAGL
jgi:hypothetical protein